MFVAFLGELPIFSLVAAGDRFTGPTDLREFSAQLGMQTARQRTAEMVRGGSSTSQQIEKEQFASSPISIPVQSIVVDRFIEIVN